MQHKLATVALMLSLAAGCVPKGRHVAESTDSADADAKTKVDSRAESPVEDGTNDGVEWVEKGIAHEGFTIDLGYRIEDADGTQSVEPVAKITRDKAPVANAMVFNSLVPAAGGEATGEEVATVYEVAPNSDAAWYAQGKLRLPDGAILWVVRFRVILPNSQQAITRDVTMEAKAITD